jgi:hypothetical protein
MVTLRIQHPVRDFEQWKIAFDSDPADRRGSGVTRYSVHRPVDDPGFVVIDLVFGTTEEANEMLGKLQKVWASGAAPIGATPDVRVLEIVESVEL